VWRERSASTVVVAVDVRMAPRATTWAGRASAPPAGAACHVTGRARAVTMVTSVNKPVAVVDVTSATPPAGCACVRVASADRTAPMPVHRALGDTTAIR